MKSCSDTPIGEYKLFEAGSQFLQVLSTKPMGVCLNDSRVARSALHAKTPAASEGLSKIAPPPEPISPQVRLVRCSRDSLFICDSLNSWLRNGFTGKHTQTFITICMHAGALKWLSGNTGRLP